MNHEHKVEFPQVEDVKKHAQKYRQLYVGLAIGLFLGYLKGHSCETKVLLVYTISS
jgi:hypothetical protein